MKKVRRLVLVLGDQLNFASAAFEGVDADRDAVLMIESRHEATYIPQHKQRLVLFFSAMRHFRDALRERGLTAHYAALDSKHNLSLIHISEPTRHTSQSRVPASA